MKDTEQAELVRVLELDYEKTTKLIEGIVGSSFTIRGWGIALISALIGLTFQTRSWQLSALAVVVTFLIAFIDGYHSLREDPSACPQRRAGPRIVLCIPSAG